MLAERSTLRMTDCTERAIQREAVPVPRGRLAAQAFAAERALVIRARRAGLFPKPLLQALSLTAGQLPPWTAVLGPPRRSCVPWFREPARWASESLFHNTLEREPVLFCGS